MIVATPRNNHVMWNSFIQVRMKHVLFSIVFGNARFAAAFLFYVFEKEFRRDRSSSWVSATEPLQISMSFRISIRRFAEGSRE